MSKPYKIVALLFLLSIIGANSQTDCENCVSFFTENHANLHGIIMSNPSASSCSDICDYLPNQIDQAYCNLYCDYAGFETFKNIVIAYEFEPEWACEEMGLCP